MFFWPDLNTINLEDGATLNFENEIIQLLKKIFYDGVISRNDDYRRFSGGLRKKSGL